MKPIEFFKRWFPSLTFPVPSHGQHYTWQPKQNKNNLLRPHTLRRIGEEKLLLWMLSLLLIDQKSWYPMEQLLGKQSTTLTRKRWESFLEEERGGEGRGAKPTSHVGIISWIASHTRTLRPKIAVAFLPSLFFYSCTPGGGERWVGGWKKAAVFFGWVREHTARVLQTTHFHTVEEEEVFIQ